MQLKFRLLPLTLFVFSTILFAQSPEQFSFQGVARNAEGKVIANNTIGVRITIHSESPSGAVVFQETHKPLTNAQGVFTLSVGKGTAISGALDQLWWKAFTHFIQLEIDAAGGNAYVDLGTTQVLSVPYAIHAKESSHWNNSLPVIQEMLLEPGLDPSTTSNDDPRLKKYLLPAVGEGNKLIWYPVKGAFRVGATGNGKWEAEFLGSQSFASGSDTEASGASSTALGQSSTASGDYSLSAGFSSKATGAASASFGFLTEAIGHRSAAFGEYTSTKTSASFVAGFYNNVADSPDPETPNDADRIFQIGNGESQSKRQNALTITRNGFLGLGKEALEPKYILDIDGRPRIRHGLKTAGIWFDDSENKTRGFVGMKTDNEVGFYLDDWQLWVNGQGNAFLKGNVSLTSDLRLKHNLSPLSGSLSKINHLQGYHYNWIDKSKDQRLQTGLIAQEVERLFPELVQTDDKGFKSVNYIGLVPHLIESIKQLAKQNESLQSLNTTIVSRLEALEAANVSKQGQTAK